jgi:hypothetical protein
MPVDPKDFFREYVMDAHDDWVNSNELCKWKAFAVANGLNALVEHAFIEKEPQNSPLSATYHKKDGGAGARRVSTEPPQRGRSSPHQVPR